MKQLNFDVAVIGGGPAGTAAAQSVATGEKANALNTDVLREQLKKDGAFLEEYRA